MTQLKLIYDDSIEFMLGEQYSSTTTDENIEMLVDKIASFLEQEKHWHVLKNAWLISGKSEDLRNLLRKALEDKS